jgi:C_GCAxxG_C_C family probable redox protein
MSDNRVEESISVLNQRYNCAQAIFSVYGQSLGVERETCLKITSVFGGGIDRTGNVCGAVTGALMAIGLKYGEKQTMEPLGSHGAAGEFIEKFRERNGTIICKKLINHDLLTKEDIDHAFKTGALNNCPRFVKDAAEILEQML